MKIVIKLNGGELDGKLQEIEQEEFPNIVMVCMQDDNDSVVKKVFYIVDKDQNKDGTYEANWNNENEMD